MARQLVTSPMTSRKSMTSYSWRYNVQSLCNQKLWPRSTSAWTLYTAHNIVQCSVKNQFIRLRTLGE